MNFDFSNHIYFFANLKTVYYTQTINVGSTDKLVTYSGVDPSAAAYPGTYHYYGVVNGQDCWKGSHYYIYWNVTNSEWQVRDRVIIPGTPGAGIPEYWVASTLPEDDYTGSGYTGTLTVSPPNYHGSITAYRTGADKKEQRPTKGVYTNQESGWQISPDELNGLVPKPADILTDDDGIDYTIIKVQQPMFNGFWGIRAIKLDLESTLRDTVTWYRATNTDDYYADKIMSDIPYQPNIPGRCQPIISLVDDMLGKRGFVEKYIFYLFSDLNLAYGDYFTIAEENNQYKYRVISCKERDSIGDLMEVLTEIIP